MLLRTLLYIVLLFSATVSTLDEHQETFENSSTYRQKRQIGQAFRHAVHRMKINVDKVGHMVIPGVQYAAERIRDDVAPSIANTVLDVTNKVVISTAKGLQKSAEFLKNEVAPVIEDAVVDMSNAAVPVVNKGIDAMGTGLKVGAKVVSKTTSDGIEHLGQSVLGEQRHSRIKKIANNLSINFNNSINNLAGAIKKVTNDDNAISQPNLYHLNEQYEVSNNDVYFDQRLLHNNQFYQPHLHPPYDRYQSKYHNYYNGYDTYDNEINGPSRNVSLPQALGKMVSNTAYTISKQILGSSLADAMAPIARSVTNAIGRSIPSVPPGNSLQQPQLPDKLRSCTTPTGSRGFCQDLKECPNLIHNMSVLRRSLCFKRLFSPGVCCPDVGQLRKLRDAKRKQAQKNAEAVKAAQEALAAQATQAAQAAQAAQAQLAANPLLQNQLLLQQGFGTFTPGQQQLLLQQQQQLLVQQQQQLLAQQQGINPALHSVNPPQQLNTPFVNDKMTRDNIILNRVPRNNNFECGVPKVPSFRVVGGDESHIGEWPWTAAIYLHGPRKTEFWCGGSLISEDYVVTAAHCTKDTNENPYDPKQFAVHLGDYSIFNHNDDKVSKPQIFSVRSINAHPAFKRQGYFNDIALVKLSRPVEFSQYILPVCLPPERMERSALDALVGQTPSVIGYGSTTYDGPQSNILRDVKLPIWKNSDCNNVYFQPITDIFLCAGFVEGGKDACQGDSGGPMQLYFEGRWVQIGIVSFGNRCAEPGYPGVYTRITSFLPWIRHNLR